MRLVVIIVGCSRSVGLWGIEGRVSLALEARVSLIRTGCLRGSLLSGGWKVCGRLVF